MKKNRLKDFDLFWPFFINPIFYFMENFIKMHFFFIPAQKQIKICAHNNIKIQSMKDNWGSWKHLITLTTRSCCLQRKKKVKIYMFNWFWTVYPKNLLHLLCSLTLPFLLGSSHSKTDSLSWQSWLSFLSFPEQTSACFLLSVKINVICKRSGLQRFLYNLLLPSFPHTFGICQHISIFVLHHPNMLNILPSLYVCLICTDPPTPKILSPNCHDYFSCTCPVTWFLWRP